VDDPVLAAALVRDAGGLAARMLRDGVNVERKTSITDLVSAADHAAEALIVSRLGAERPDDGVVGEEGASRPGRGRTWFVDPVDGTYNFLAGLPVWCSALALADVAEPATTDARRTVDAADTLLGAVYQPATDELWLGGRDHPTSRNGVPVSALEDQPFADLSLSTYLHPARLSDYSVRLPWLQCCQARRLSGCSAPARSNWPQ
jgi:fructose-1,6-bisphosphatase/inositol monophosphatase family enzyme